MPLCFVFIWLLTLTSSFCFTGLWKPLCYISVTNCTFLNVPIPNDTVVFVWVGNLRYVRDTQMAFFLTQSKAKSSSNQNLSILTFPLIRKLLYHMTFASQSVTNTKHPVASVYVINMTGQFTREKVLGTTWCRNTLNVPFYTDLPCLVSRLAIQLELGL